MSDPIKAALALTSRIDAIYRDAVRASPALKRGQVWCIACGNTLLVDSAAALRRGWPTCCGATMTIDGPMERATREGRDG
jgi:hypothetical protein